MPNHQTPTRFEAEIAARQFMAGATSPHGPDYRAEAHRRRVAELVKRNHNLATAIGLVLDEDETRSVSNPLHFGRTEHFYASHVRVANKDTYTVRHCVAWGNRVSRRSDQSAATFPIDVEKGDQLQSWLGSEIAENKEVAHAQKAGIKLFDKQFALGELLVIHMASALHDEALISNVQQVLAQNGS